MEISQRAMVDLATAFNIAMTLVAFLGGFLLNMLFQRIKDLEKADKGIESALTVLRVELPSHYVSKEEFQQMGNSIFEALRRIEDKIDRKVDKS